MIPSHMTRAVFPDVPVGMVTTEAPASFSLATLGNGPLMTAVVHASDHPGVIGMRVFAYADEIPHLDLSLIRHRGRATTLTEWTPVQPGTLRIGPTLRLAPLSVPGVVEILDFLPRYETVEAA